MTSIPTPDQPVGSPGLPRIVQLRDGRSCRIRLIEAADADRLQQFVRSLSAASAQQRFFGSVHELSAAQLKRFTASPDPMDFAVIAHALHEGVDPAVEPFTGTARCLRTRAGSRQASQAPELEFAVTIADDWQDVGLGRLLLGELIALASARGVAALTGEVLSDNTRMIELVRQLGFTVRPDPSDARTTLLRLELQRAGCPVRHPGDNG